MSETRFGSPRQTSASGNPLLARARAALDAPWVTRWLWIVPLLAALPAVVTGYVLDDFQQQSMVKGTYDSSQRGPGDLYCFSLGPGQSIDPAILSWWDDPSSSLCFLRPLSSWTLWIDHNWLWRWPVLPHLHSILWFMGLWFAWRAILLRYLPTRVANLALLLTATSGAVAMTSGWIASRHALVGGFLGIAGLYQCWVSRDAATVESARIDAREVFGWLLIGLGLLSSEMVLGIFGFLVAREWLSRGSDPKLHRRSLVRIAAYAAFGLGFVGMHARLGYGAPKYPLYLNASGDPWTFLRAVPERLLALSGDLVLGVPSDSWVYPNLVLILALVSVVAAATLVVAVVLVWPALQGASLRPLRWLSLGGLLSLAPALSGMQGGRALTLAAFPAYALIAVYLLEYPVLRSARGWLGRTVGKLALVTLAVGVFLGNPAAHFAWFGVLAELDRVGEKSLPDSAIACQPGADVYMIDASELGAAAWYARYWLKDKLQARHYHQLTMSPLGVTRIRMTRTGPSQLTLRSSGGPLVGEMAIPPGSGEVFHVDMTRRYEDYGVRVTELSERDRGPVALDFDFSRSLSDPRLCIFVQDDAHLYQLAVPHVGTDHVIESASPMQLLSREGAQLWRQRAVPVRVARLDQGALE